MRYLALIGALLAAQPAFADPVTVTFSDSEQQALHDLLDLGVKAGGLAVAGNADYLWRKIETPPPVPASCDPSKGSCPANPSAGETK